MRSPRLLQAFLSNPTRKRLNGLVGYREKLGPGVVATGGVRDRRRHLAGFHAIEHDPREQTHFIQIGEITHPLAALSVTTGAMLLEQWLHLTVPGHVLVN